MLKRNIHRNLDLPGLMQRARNLPGVLRVNHVIGQSKLRRIKKVKDLAPQFQLATLFELEVFEDGKVGVVKRWTSEAAAACVSEHGGV